MNKVSIIAGCWRSYPISFLETNGLRPTPSRVRETLFNWLNVDIINATVLDLFSGSGVLAFEALSRGAKSATLVENNIKTYQQLQQQAQKFKPQPINVDIVCQDAFNYIKSANNSFDIIFLDPPFRCYDLVELLLKIAQSHLIKSKSKIYLESEMAITIHQLPHKIQLLKQKKAADVHYALIEVD